MRDKRTTIVILALAVLALAGCEEAYRAYQDPSYIPSETELTRIVEEWPDDDPLKPTAQAVALSRYATAVAADSVAQQAQLTVDAAHAQADQQRAILTAEAQSTRDALSARATQQALDAQATREALAVEATRAAEAEAAAHRATMQAVEATRTVEAQQATATAQAANVTATAQAASVQATKDAEAATATAVSGQATATVQAQWDQATRVALQATQERERLDLQRERILHPLKIAGAVLFMLAGAGFLVDLAVPVKAIFGNFIQAFGRGGFFSRGRDRMAVAKALLAAVAGTAKGNISRIPARWLGVIAFAGIVDIAIAFLFNKLDKGNLRI